MLGIKESIDLMKTYGIEITREKMISSLCLENAKIANLEHHKRIGNWELGSWKHRIVQECGNSWICANGGNSWNHIDYPNWMNSIHYENIMSLESPQLCMGV